MRLSLPILSIKGVAPFTAAGGHSGSQWVEIRFCRKRELLVCVHLSYRMSSPAVLIIVKTNTPKRLFVVTNEQLSTLLGCFLLLAWPEADDYQLVSGLWDANWTNLLMPKGKFFFCSVWCLCPISLLVVFKQAVTNNGHHHLTKSTKFYARRRQNDLHVHDPVSLIFK